MMNLKCCYICLHEKPLTDFLNSSVRKDGKRGECRDCGRKVKRKKGKTPEQVRRNNARQRETGYTKKYRRESPVYRAAERARRSRKYHSNPEYRRKVREKLDAAKTPEKSYARKMVSRALKAGKIAKSQCACGSLRNLQAHHGDYNKPLDVIWMCASCHAKHHQKKLVSTNVEDY